MQPVKFLSEIHNTVGAWGFSALVSLWDGEVNRQTLYFIRDEEGWVKHVLILDAKEAL